jgi:hypothetical protein
MTFIGLVALLLATSFAGVAQAAGRSPLRDRPRRGARAQLPRAQRRARIVAIAMGILGVGWAAAAQPPAAGVAVRRSDEIVRSLRLAEHNQLGILEYCLAQGAIAEDVVAMQRAALNRLPGADVAGLDEAEAAGRRGIVAFGTSQVPIAAAAMGEGITVSSRCKQMALTVQAQAGKPLTW